MKKSGDIHQRNIPTKKSENSLASYTVTDGRMDGQTDRPTTHHGNRSSGPKK